MKLIYRLFTAIFALGVASVLATASAAESSDSLVVCVFGDSYVRNHRRPMTETWHYKAAERLGLKYVNIGRNGSAVSFENKGFGPAMTYRAKTELPERMDCLLIIAGHNDASKISDDAGMQLFEQSLSSMLTEIKGRYPEAKIGYVLPWHVDRGYFDRVIDIILNVCKTQGIPVFDAEAAGGIKVNDPEFRGKYFQNGGVNDTAHLNAAGHDLIVEKGTDFISQLIR